MMMQEAKDLADEFGVNVTSMRNNLASNGVLENEKQLDNKPESE